jgi:hypothetical protein
MGKSVFFAHIGLGAGKKEKKVDSLALVSYSCPIEKLLCRTGTYREIRLSGNQGVGYQK